MEVPSEDAFFMSTYVRHLVPAMQGGLHADPYFKIVATCKHYAGYDLESRSPRTPGPRPGRSLDAPNRLAWQ